MEYTLHIKKYRVKKNMTQKELADTIGTSQTYISRLENNKIQALNMHPPFGLLLNISKILEICPHIMITYNYSCEKNCIYNCDNIL
jgi:transcriptional regulator with XRE-family HTH domain